MVYQVERLGSQVRGSLVRHCRILCASSFGFGSLTSTQISNIVASLLDKNIYHFKVIIRETEMKDGVEVCLIIKALPVVCRRSCITSLSRLA